MLTVLTSIVPLDIGVTEGACSGRSYCRHSPRTILKDVYKRQGLLYPFDEYNALAFNVEANKLLVPTPPVKDQANPEAYDAAREKYLNTSSIAGIFTSWADAPGGFKEELQEVSLRFGAEYSYNNRFFLRAGYHYLHPDRCV